MSEKWQSEKWWGPQQSSWNSKCASRTESWGDTSERQAIDCQSTSTFIALIASEYGEDIDIRQVQL